jgi:hypothetical protein
MFVNNSNVLQWIVHAGNTDDTCQYKVFGYVCVYCSTYHFELCVVVLNKIHH